MQKSLSSLIKEYNSLPIGSIYKKYIKNKEYFYYQYSLNNVKVSKYVTKEEAILLEVDIKRRKELGEEIKKITNNQKRDIVLSESARNLTGYVMKADTPVAVFSRGELVWMDEKLVPFIIKRTHSIILFLKNRVIDSSRANSRLLKKVLDIIEEDEEKISLYSYSCSLTDEYWFKPRTSKLKYDDVRFTNDLYFDLALKGVVASQSFKRRTTPDLVTNGSYEKGWKIINGEWWLYKKGTNEEIFSELLYSTLLEKLNIPTAHYEYDDGYIRSKNFSRGYNYEPMSSLVGSDDNYQMVFDTLYQISEKVTRDYLLLIYFDVLFNNIDRHNDNYGVLRDRNSGEIISLAPNFDNNLSFISRDQNLAFSPRDGFSKLFLEFVRKNEKAKALYQKMDVPSLNRDIIKEVLDSIPLHYDDEKIIGYILQKQDFLKENILKIDIK